MPWSSRDKSCSMGSYTSIKQVLVLVAWPLPVEHTTILINDPIWHRECGSSFSCAMTGQSAFIWSVGFVPVF
jgi:hypothetical protein